jgi:hypothetical protein
MANGSPVVAQWAKAARGSRAGPTWLGWALTAHTEIDGHNRPALDTLLFGFESRDGVGAIKLRARGQPEREALKPAPRASSRTAFV